MVCFGRARGAPRGQSLGEVSVGVVYICEGTDVWKWEVRKEAWARGRDNGVLCSQETSFTSGAAPSPGGPRFVIQGAVHFAWPRRHPLFLPGEWPRRPGSRPPCPYLALALALRSVPALSCPWEEGE